jgi:polysaccharide pyruvyl transferase WcaK-like protein
LNILVYGGWFGSGNLGDEAILQGVNQIIKKKLPEAKLTALSINPEYTYEHTGVRGEKIESPRTLLRNRERYLELFKKTDAHLLTGGTPFYDYGHLSRTVHMGLPALSKRKVFCFGVGSKPITTLRGREITRILLKNTAIISTRDIISKHILQSLSGKLAKPITVTGDSALMLDPVKSEKEQDHVLFCPRRLTENHKVLFHQETDRTTINRVRHMQALAADRLIEDGYRVSFMPFHCVAPDDDREEIRVIKNLMQSETEILPRPKNTADALRKIGASTLVVGLRLHSLVLAALQSTPFISIDYDIKIQGFMERMNSPEYLLNTVKGLDTLYERAEKALLNQKEYSRHIKKQASHLRKVINNEADNMVRVLTQRKNDYNKT